MYAAVRSFDKPQFSVKSSPLNFTQSPCCPTT